MFFIIIGYDIHIYPLDEEIRQTAFPLSPLRRFPTAFTLVPRARLSTLVESNVYALRLLLFPPLELRIPVLLLHELLPEFTGDPFLPPI